METQIISEKEVKRIMKKKIPKILGVGLAFLSVTRISTLFRVMGKISPTLLKYVTELIMIVTVL